MRRYRTSYIFSSCLSVVLLLDRYRYHKSQKNCKMIIKIVFMLTLASNIRTQNDAPLYYPSEDGGIAQILNNSEMVQIVPPNVRLNEIRGTSVYEEYVDRIISNGVSKLTLAINKALLNKDKKDYGNVVFAPVGIAAALSLVFLGSNGKTFQELSNIMGLATGVVDIEKKSQFVHDQFGRMLSKLEQNAGFEIGNQVNVASAIFVQDNYPIRPIYKDAALELYRSEILNLDFRSNPVAAQSTVNTWVSQRTKGKIKTILNSPPSVATKVIIASALYFKAKWAVPFFEGTTTKRPFYTNGRKSPTNIEAEMMANGGHFPYFKDHTLNCEIMGFPYEGNSSTMYVVIPFESDKSKLKHFEENLTPSELDRLADSTVSTDSIILFPKMQIESTNDLKDSLEALGLKSLFDPSQANLALLSSGEAGALTSRFGGDINDTLNTQPNCTQQLQDLSKNISICEEITGNGTVLYKRFGNKIGRKILRKRRALKEDTLDNIRLLINQQSTSNNYQNPGLYADSVIHKVYMSITETGTEAAAATAVSLSRSGSRVTFRVDVPFLFFIRHEATKVIMFWGSVTTPTPSFKKV